MTARGFAFSEGRVGGVAWEWARRSWLWSFSEGSVSGAACRVSGMDGMMREMSGNSERIFISKSSEETRAMGARWARSAFPGQIICLDGDLGAGKTVFAQGFAEGLGIKAAVTSPTFTILQIYRGGRIPLYHFDVYRIEEPEEMEAIGYEEYFFGDGICLVEWSENIEELIPPEADRIRINRVPGEEDSGRAITWTKGSKQ
jgi:tRNA threonylcarbamoyladenosine biosynthesis protein TsaE